MFLNTKGFHFFLIKLISSVIRSLQCVFFYWNNWMKWVGFQCVFFLCFNTFSYAKIISKTCYVFPLFKQYVLFFNSIDTLMVVQYRIGNMECIIHTDLSWPRANTKAFSTCQHGWATLHWLFNHRTCFNFPPLTIQPVN